MKQSHVARLLAVVCFLLCTIPLFSQSNTAQLTGTVQDPQGAVVPGATVTITSSRGKVTTVQSNGSGFYTASALDPEAYTIDVKAQGFKTITQNITLVTQQQAQLNFTLQAGSTTETVEVTSNVPLVDAVSSSVSEVIEGSQITELPLNGENFTQLATLAPGVTRGVPGGQQTGEGNQAETFRYSGNGGAALSVNGLRPQANNFLLDGFDNNESLVNTIVFFTSPEAIQEFRVDTSVAPAEFGRAGGGIVNSTFRSGNNTWHGSLFEFIRNQALDANGADYFNPLKNGKPTPYAPFRRNQFGATVGGALIKNKLFIFGDYMGLRQEKPASLDTATVPTPQMRTGDFSQLLNIYNPSNPPVPNQILIHHAGASSAATQVAYAGNIIPSTDFVGAGQAYLNAFPLPNLPGSSTLCQQRTIDGVCLQKNFQIERQQIQNYDDFDIRADYILRSQDSMFVRYSYDKSSDTTTTRLPGLPAGFGSGLQFAYPRSWVYEETHTFSPNVINEFRFGWIRTNLGYVPPYDSVPLAANLGIPNANTSPLLGGGALIGGYNSQLEYTGDYGPYQVPENTYQLADNVSWTKGHHTFKFGGNFMWRQVNLFRPKAGKGYFFISGNGSDYYSTGYEVSDVLAGFMNNYQVGPALGYSGTRSWENGIFAQDDWRVTSRLTLNLGVRWDLLTWPTEVHNRQSNFDVNPGSATYGQLLLPGQAGYNDAFVPTDHHDFAPRLGFAYDLSGNGKRVLRGGYGMFFFVDRGGIDNQLAQNAPFSGVAQYNYTDGYRFTLGGQAPLNSTDPTQGGTVAMPNKNDFVVDFQNPANISLVSYLKSNVPSNVQEWNLQFEQAFGANSSLSVAYVGNKGTHLVTYYDLNRQIYGAANGVKLFPLLSSVTVHDTNGNSNYNSLQTSYTRRLSKGIQITANYVWSHAIDDSPGAFDANNTVDWFNLAHERANSDLDVRHRFVFSALYELPFGRNREFGSSWNRVTDAILGGWQISPILELSSGAPVDVSLGNGSPATRPDLVGSTKQLGSISGQWFTTTSFVSPGVVGGVVAHPGDAPRNPFTGPGYDNVDLSLQKTFAITERVKTEFRAEFFNIMNTPHFGQPDGNKNDGSNFGRVTTIGSDSWREIEFALRVMF